MNTPTMELVEPFTDDEMLEMYEYLDDLRESGQTNMFGARPYLMDEFDMQDKSLASKVLTSWMHTFGARHPKERNETR